MNSQQYAQYQETVARMLKGLSFVSTGACPGCHECGLGETDCRKCDGDGKDWQHGHEDSPCPACNGGGVKLITDLDIEAAGETSFSWSDCDACRSCLGGDRHPAHGRMDDGKILHLSVCTDCLYYLNYGQLDDQSMLEIEAGKAGAR